MSIFFLFLIFIILLQATYSVYKKERATRQNLLRSISESEKLKNRKEELGKLVKYLETDEGIESEIRSKFRGIKDGEQVAIIVDSNPVKKEQAEVVEESLWVKIKSFFGII